MIILKDEQGKKIGNADTMEEAIQKAWTIRGQYFTNPLIVFYDETGRIGQYPKIEEVGQ